MLGHPNLYCFLSEPIAFRFGFCAYYLWAREPTENGDKEMNKEIEVKTTMPVPDSWRMNRILQENDSIQDTDRVLLVNLWCEHNRLRAELRTLKRLVEIAEVNGDRRYD